MGTNRTITRILWVAVVFLAFIGVATRRAVVLINPGAMNARKNPAASLGAGISMGFAESLSDDGSLTGRGSPWIRGTATGLMTTAGGLGHTLPFLIKDFRVAMTVAMLVVAVELGTISFARHKYSPATMKANISTLLKPGTLILRRDAQDPA